MKTTNGNSALIAALITIIGVIVAFVLLPTPFALIGAGAAIACGWIYYRSKHTSRTAAPTPEPAASQDPVATSVEALLDINLELRKAGAPAMVLARFESLIDKIMAVLPDVHAQTPGGDLAWAIQRIATEYLPNKSVRPYLGLPEGERAAAEASVVNGLSGMESELDEIAELVKHRKTSDFNSKAEFLRRRFEV